MTKAKSGRHPSVLHSSQLQGLQNRTRRADIQSLRALAIGLVVAAHAHLRLIAGGYIGVDVFFVLSGYLISGLVLREVESTGRFQAWQFYARRLKRLLPAMLLVLLSVAVVGWLLISPEWQRNDAGAGQAASIWLSNFYFAARVINYFSSSINNNLFLHTWSLAVEEQFYLVWPWSLLFLYGIWQWQGAPMSYKRLATGLGIVAAVSLAIGVYWSHTNVDAGFYLMPGRVWEFALGALTFLLRKAMEKGRFARIGQWRGRSLLNTTGWLLILLASVIYGDDLRYPGLWALLPCLGALLVLLDAPEKQPTSLFSRLVLRQPFLQFVGDISYSLYLWHWPVLILGNQIFGSGALTEVSLVALSITLASMTYYAVERPIHRAPLRNSVNVLLPSVVGAALGFFIMGAWQNAAVNLMKEPAQARIIAAAWNVPKIYDQRGCDTWYHSAKVIPCGYGPTNARHTAVMFGDSVLAQWFPAVAHIFLHMPGWRLVVLTKSSCPAAQVSYYYNMIKAKYTVCDSWRQHALGFIVQLHPDVVIMGSSRYYDFSSAQWINGTRAVLNRLSPAAHAVVIMRPTPRLGFNGLDCIAAQTNWPDWLPQFRHCERPLKPPSSQGALESLKQAAKPYPNVRVIDLSDAICPDGICRARLGSTIVYRDGLHMTASFVRSLAPILRRSLQTNGILQ